MQQADQQPAAALPLPDALNPEAGAEITGMRTAFSVAALQQEADDLWNDGVFYQFCDRQLYPHLSPDDAALWAELPTDTLELEAPHVLDAYDKLCVFLLYRYIVWKNLPPQDEPLFPDFYTTDWWNLPPEQSAAYNTVLYQLLSDEQPQAALRGDELGPGSLTIYRCRQQDEQDEQDDDSPPTDHPSPEAEADDTQQAKRCKLDMEKTTLATFPPAMLQEEAETLWEADNRLFFKFCNKQLYESLGPEDALLRDKHSTSEELRLEAPHVYDQLVAALLWYTDRYLVWKHLPPIGKSLFPDFYTTDWENLAPEQSTAYDCFGRQLHAGWLRSLSKEQQQEAFDGVFFTCEGAESFKAYFVQLQEEQKQPLASGPILTAPAPQPLQLPTQEDYDSVGCSLDMLKFVNLGGSDVQFDPNNPDDMIQPPTLPNPGDYQSYKTVRTLYNGVRLEKTVAEKQIFTKNDKRYYKTPSHTKGCNVGDYLATKVPGMTLEHAKMARLCDGESTNAYQEIRKVVAIPYYDENFILRSIRSRTTIVLDGILQALKNKDGTSKVKVIAKMMSPNGHTAESDANIPFGLPLLTILRNLHIRRVLIVEGESDTFSVYVNTKGLICIGFPGATSYIPMWERYFEGLEVLVWKEPDKGGDDMMDSLRRLFRFPYTVLDPTKIEELVVSHIKDAAALAKYCRTNPGSPPLIHYIELMAQFKDLRMPNQNVLMQPSEPRRQKALLEGPAPAEATPPAVVAAFPLDDQDPIWANYQLGGGQANAEGFLRRARLNNTKEGVAVCAMGHIHEGDNQKLNNFGHCLSTVTCYRHPALSRVVPLDPELTGGLRPWHNSTGLPEIQAFLERHGCTVAVSRSDGFTFSARDLAQLQLGDTAQLIGGTGTGKTKAVTEWLVSWPIFPDILMPLVSVALVKNMTRRVNELLETNHSPVRMINQIEARVLKLKVDQKRHHITCPESGFHLAAAKPYQVIFADEITELAANLDSSTMIQQRIDPTPTLTSHMVRAGILVAASADPDISSALMLIERLLTVGNSKTLQVIQLQEPNFIDPSKPLPTPEDIANYRQLCRHQPPGPDPPPQYYPHTNHPALGVLPPPRVPPEWLPFFYKTPRSVVMVPYLSTTRNLLYEALTAHLKAVAYCASKKLGREILAQCLAEFPSLRAILLSKDDDSSVDVMTTDPDQWRRYDLVIHTGVLSAGVDISFDEGPYFDVAFAFFNPACGTVEHQWQAVDRVRQFHIPVLFVHVGFLAMGHRVQPAGQMAELQLPTVLPTDPWELHLLRQTINRHIHAQHQLRLAVTHNDFKRELIRRAIAKGEPVYTFNGPKVASPFRPVPDLAIIRATEIFETELVSRAEYYELLATDAKTYDQVLSILRYRRSVLLEHWETHNFEGRPYQFNFDNLLRVERSLPKIKVTTVLLHPILLRKFYSAKTGMGDEAFAKKVRHFRDLFTAMNWSLDHRKSPPRLFDCAQLAANPQALDALRSLVTLSNETWSDSDPGRVYTALPKMLRQLGCSVSRRGKTATVFKLKKRQFEKWSQIFFYASGGSRTLEGIA